MFILGETKCAGVGCGSYVMGFASCVVGFAKRVDKKEWQMTST